ncbi:MAG TPA: hypothetical protein VF777_07565 [Phycisphaerales bacterium]
MTRIDPNALRLAGAYQTAANRKPSSSAASSAGNTQPFDSLRRADAVVDQVAIARPEKLAASVSKLAAATVAGSAVKPAASSSAPAIAAPASTYTARGTLSMYAQPGERNTAATGVALGRVLDAQG